MKKNNTTFKWDLMKFPVGIIALFCVLALSISSTVAQTTVFSDNFDRGGVVTPISAATTPFSITYTTTTTGTGTGSGNTSRTNVQTGSDYSLQLLSGDSNNPISTVTTQSATTSNSSATVTLSASNASIAVGQAVTGLNVGSGNTVKTISGTTLTLNSATNSSGAATGTLTFSTPTSQTSARTWVSGPLSSFSSPFNNTLSSNSGTVTWTFNMKTNRSTAGSGFSGNSYAYSVVLAATNANFASAASAASGYAVQLVRIASGQPNAVSLVKFASATPGLQNTPTTIIGTSTGLTGNTDWVAVKVVYTPSTNTWKLFVRDDTGGKGDPITTATQVGVAAGVVDNTYTGSTMTHYGYFINGSTGSSYTSSTALFDDFKVVVGAPEWTSGLPKADTPLLNGFTVRAKTTIPGTAYYVVLSSGSTAPTSAQVKAGTDASDGSLASNLKGTLTLSASTEASVAITGLPSIAGITYDVYIVAEDLGSTPALQSAPIKSSVTTVVAPPVNQPTNLVFSNVGTTGLKIDYTAAVSGADNYLIIRNAGSAPTGTPVNNVVYTAGQTNIGSGTNTVAYVGPLTSFTETALNGSTTYYYAVYAYNSIANPSYQTTSPLIGSQITDLAVKCVTGATTTGLTANWYPIPTADNYDIKIYDAGNNVVNTTNATGQATASKAITQSLSAGLYTFTVTGKIGSTPIKESLKSLSFEIIAGKTLTQYTSADALGTDIAAASGPDYYELITSGGTYLITVSNTSQPGTILTRGFVLRAHSSLSAKPKFTYSSTQSSTSATVYSTAATTGGLTFQIEGIELDGVNKNVSATQQNLFINTLGTSGTGVKGCAFIFKDCYIHHWLNAAGNGFIRPEVASSADGTDPTTISMDNCVVDNCGGRFITPYATVATGSSVQKYGDISITNSSFSNFTASLTNPNSIVFYRTSGSGTLLAYGTTMTVNHCTFYNINTGLSGTPSAAVVLFQLQNMSGQVTVKNNIFDNQGFASNYCPYDWNTSSSNGSTPVFDSNYSVGLQGAVSPAISTPTTVTNPVSGATPSYTGAGSLNFVLTSKTNLIATDGYVVGNTFGVLLSPLSPPTTLNNATPLVTSCTADWSTVSNSTGYMINVYTGGSTLVKSVRVATNSATVTGLTANTSYTYKVIAIGDATSYSSSTESSPSNSFTTLPPAPAISSFTPTNAANGTSVVITGTNFTSASAVSFGGTAASSYTVNNDTQITATVAAGATGSVSVTTTSGTGTKTGFTWLAPLTTIPNAQTATASGLSLNASSVVTIQSGGSLTIDDGANSPNSITVQPGGKLSLTDGKTLTSTVTLQNTTGASASFVDSNVADTPPVVTGSVAQDIAATDRNWYVSVPISGKTSTALTFGATIVKRDEANVAWTTLISGADLVPGVGYISTASTAGTATWNISGNLNSGKIQVPVTCTGASFTGYNLLGNPYPSYLNWSAVLNLNATNASILQPTIWYRTKSGATYTFQTYNATGDVATPKNTSGYIPPMQAFWVKANTGGGTVTLTNAMRSHGDGSANMLKVRSVNASVYPILRIAVQNITNINTDEAVVYFNVNASNKFDAYDSQKMSNSNAAIPEIYTTAGAEKLVINGMNAIQLDTPIGLGFVPGSGTSFSIKANEISNLPADVKVFLKDNVTLAETDLTDGISTYSFSPEITSADRFSIIFRTSGAVTGINNYTNNSVLVYYNNNHGLTIKTNNDKLIGSAVSVYNALGQQLINTKLSGVTMNVDFPYAPNVYFVRVDNVLKKVTVK